MPDIEDHTALMQVILEETTNVTVTESHWGDEDPGAGFQGHCSVRTKAQTSLPCTALHQSLQNLLFPRLTFGDFDVQSCPDQSHQGGGEVDCHVLSYWHIHQNQPLCQRERKEEEENVSEETRVRGEETGRGQRQRRKRRARIPHPLLCSPLLSGGPTAARLGDDAKFQGKGTDHSTGLHRGPKNVFRRDGMGFLEDVAQGKESALGGGSIPRFKAALFPPAHEHPETQMERA